MSDLNHTNSEPDPVYTEGFQLMLERKKQESFNNRLNDFLESPWSSLLLDEDIEQINQILVNNDCRDVDLNKAVKNLGECDNFDDLVYFFQNSSRKNPMVASLVSNIRFNKDFIPAKANRQEILERYFLITKAVIAQRLSQTNYREFNFETVLGGIRRQRYSYLFSLKVVGGTSKLEIQELEFLAKRLNRKGVNVVGGSHFHTHAPNPES